MALIRIENVGKTFGDNHVLKDVSLSVDKGEVICIIGPSGSGKSTLLRCINNLEQIDAGRIYLDDELIGMKPHGDGSFVRLIGREQAKQREKFGFVFQHFQLFPNHTVLENITLGPIRVKGKSRQKANAKAFELLKRVGLEDKADAYPAGISGGQQQRVAIARAMAMEPAVLLFDEPTSALDPELVGEVLKTIKQLAESDMTMIIVTHELSFARRVADRIAFFDDGHIVENGPPEQILENPQDRRTKKFLSAVEEAF